MTEIDYNRKRSLHSAANDIMSDIKMHTEGMSTALHLTQSESSESFHSSEIIKDVIMLEMILEEFEGNVPEEFRPFQTIVEQRQKMYSETMGSDFYYNRRKSLEAELADQASVPELTEEEQEKIKKAKVQKPRYVKKEAPELPKITLELTGKRIRFYTFELQQMLLKDEKELRAVEPLEARLEKDAPLFSELPEHYTIVCIETNQQIQVDVKGTIEANPFYRDNKEVFFALDNAAHSGKNLFGLQQLYETLKKKS